MRSQLLLSVAEAPSFGCTLGDILAEWLLFAFPVVLFGHKIFGSWAVDFGLAFLLGIAFQYFTIATMRGLSFKDGLLAALKADTLSLTAWQVGMYGWMAIATFLLFGHEMPKTDPVFWFMMQLAMWLGFATISKKRCKALAGAPQAGTGRSGVS